MNKRIQYTIVNGQIIDSWTKAPNLWGHPLHRLCSRVGAVPPKMANYFITKYSKPGQTVLDPFSGKGTIPFEAALNNRYAIGNDVLDDGFVLTRAKLRPPLKDNFIKDYLPNIKKFSKEVKEKDVKIDLNDEDLRTFFRKSTLNDILKLRHTLLNRKKRSDADFFLSAVVLGLLHGCTSNSFSIPCSHSYSMSPTYVRKYIKNYKISNPKSVRFHYRKKDIWKRILNKTEIIYRTELPLTFRKGRAYCFDAAYLLNRIRGDNKKVDLILTSPPYFDAQNYAWDNWIRLWFLGKNYKTYRKKLFCTGSKSLYLNQMKDYVDLMYDVLSKDAPCFLILGDVKKKGKVINTAKILATTLLDNGTEFQVKRIWRDKIPKNRKTLTYVNENDGVKFERILELHKGKVRRKKTQIRW